MKNIKQALSEFLSPNGTLLRYSLSYCFLLSLLPTLIVGISFFQNSILDTESILPIIYQYIPENLIKPFIDYIMDKDFNNIVSLVISLAVSCYVASNALYSFLLISAKNESFDTYNILIRIKSVILFVVMFLGIIGIGLITHFLNLGIMITLSVGLVVSLYLFFRTLSFRKRPLSFGVIGAIFTSIAILLLGQLFFYIIVKFTTYESVYGPLSSIVVLLLSAYVISSVIYLGYCLNYAFANKTEKEEVKHKVLYQTGENIINKLKSLVIRK